MQTTEHRLTEGVRFRSGCDEQRARLERIGAIRDDHSQAVRGIDRLPGWIPARTEVQR